LIFNFCGELGGIQFNYQNDSPKSQLTLDPTETEQNIGDVRYCLYLPIHGSICGFNSKISNFSGNIYHFGFEIHNDMSKAQIE